jgi:uncharacterized protein (UPF0332 family)
MTGNGGHEVDELWQRALASLSAAEKLLADGFADFAASRAYYATFYAASALLVAEGKRFSKHSAVIARIHQDYVKTGRLPTAIGKIITSLYDLRGIGDYGGVAHVKAPTAAAAIADARTFVEAIRPMVENPS